MSSFVRTARVRDSREKQLVVETRDRIINLKSEELPRNMKHASAVHNYVAPTGGLMYPCFVSVGSSFVLICLLPGIILIISHPGPSCMI